MRSLPNWKIKPSAILLPGVCACLLTACAGSTGLVHADLNSRATQQLAAKVRKECAQVAPLYPERELTMEEVERLARLDGKEALDCSESAIAYVNHITTRDRVLMQSRIATWKPIKRALGNRQSIHEKIRPQTTQNRYLLHGRQVSPPNVRNYLTTYKDRY